MTMVLCLADVRPRLCYYVSYRIEVWARLRDINQDYADYAHT